MARTKIILDEDTQAEIVKLLGEGQTPRYIAEQLNEKGIDITGQTIYNHFKSYNRRKHHAEKEKTIIIPKIEIDRGKPLSLGWEDYCRER